MKTLLRMVKNALLGLVYFYYRVFNYHHRKVLVKSELSSFNFDGVKIPVRVFTALSRRNSEMGHLKVMAGRFQKVDFQYCLVYDLYINPLYRRRGLAEKLLKKAISFVTKERFSYIVGIVRQRNRSSRQLFAKSGFDVLKTEAYFEWEEKETKGFNEPVDVVRFTTGQ